MVAHNVSSAAGTPVSARNRRLQTAESAVLTAAVAIAALYCLSFWPVTWVYVLTVLILSGMIGPVIGPFASFLVEHHSCPSYAEPLRIQGLLGGEQFFLFASRLLTGTWSTGWLAELAGCLVAGSIDHGAPLRLHLPDTAFLWLNRRCV